MRPLLYALLALPLAACGNGKRCCKDDDCVGDERSGSEVLRFDGEVPHNLLMISIDTLRRDHLGAYGSDKGLTPFLDKVAREGMVLKNHHTCSDWTMASTTCTVAGRSNVDRGHEPRLFGPTSAQLPVPPGTPFLATWLGDAGYVSAISSANGFFQKKSGNTQGYDDEIDWPGTVEAYRQVRNSVRQLSDGGKTPWFMHVHSMEPHASYDPDEEFTRTDPDVEPWPEDLRKRKTHYDYRDRWNTLTPDEKVQLEANLRLLYEGEVRTVDARVKEAWELLDADCWLDDTLVVIWTDHGEAFWEHGYQTHAFNLTGEETDGVAILWSKNMVPGEWTEPTSAIDLVPTILDLFEIPIPDEVTGMPLGTAPADRPIFMNSLARLRGVQAVERNGKKLQLNWAFGGLRYWDRNVDPLETEDIFDPEDPDVQELWALLEPEVARMADVVVDHDPAPVYPQNMP